MNSTPKKRGSSPWGLVLTGLLGLVLLLGPGCGFIEGFFGSEPADEGPQLSAEAKKKVAERKKAAAEAKAEADADATAEEEAQRLTVDKLRARQQARLAEYSFDPQGAVDPFFPLDIIIQTTTSTKKVPPKDLPPLQRMELSQLKLVAIIMANAGPRALVEDATGTGYIIEKGTKMGLRDGVVSAIKPDLIEVEEQYKNYLGESKSKVIALKLHPAEGEGK